MEISDETISQLEPYMTVRSRLPPWEVTSAYLALAGAETRPAAFLLPHEPEDGEPWTWVIVGLRGQVLISVRAEGPYGWDSRANSLPRGVEVVAKAQSLSEVTSVDVTARLVPTRRDRVVADPTWHIRLRDGRSLELSDSLLGGPEPAREFCERLIAAMGDETIEP